MNGSQIQTTSGISNTPLIMGNDFLNFVEDPIEYLLLADYVPPSVLHNYAFSLLQAEQSYGKAELIFRKLLNTNFHIPTDIRSVISSNLAWTLLLQGKPKEASHLFTNSLTVNEEDWQYTWRSYGIKLCEYLLIGDDQDALNLLEKLYSKVGKVSTKGLKAKERHMIIKDIRSKQ